MAVVLTSNLHLLDAQGNVLLASSETGLTKDAAVVVVQVVTLDKDYLSARAGKVPKESMLQVEDGLRLALDL